MVVTIAPADKNKFTELARVHKVLDMDKIRTMLVSRSESLSLSPTPNIAQENVNTSNGYVKKNSVNLG